MANQARNKPQISINICPASAIKTRLFNKNPAKTSTEINELVNMRTNFKFFI